MNPSSHTNCSLCGYVVRLPTKDPLLGVLRTPQSFAVDKSGLYQVRIIPETKSRYTANNRFTMASLYCLFLFFFFRLVEKSRKNCCFYSVFYSVDTNVILSALELMELKSLQVFQRMR